MEVKFRHELGALMDHLGLVGATVEIGVAEGHFSEKMISWPGCTKHYMIDAWQRLRQKGDASLAQEWHDDNYEGMLRRTEPFKHKRVVLRGLSKEMIDHIPNDELVLAYVDGDHSYEGCLSDLIKIWPKIQVGGVLAGHDYLNQSYGVHRAVSDFASMILKDDGDVLTVHIIEDEDPSMASFWLRKEEKHVNRL